MNKKIKVIIAFVLSVAIFIGAYFLYKGLSEDYKTNELPSVSPTSENSNKNEEHDYSVPDFTALDYNNNEVTLSEYFGKPIVLNMWASWCPPCKNEMPHFESAYKEHKDVQFLMLNMTASDSMKDAKDYIESEGYTFPVLFDTTGEAAYKYGASSLPVTFFINSKGELVTYASGSLTADILDKGINMIK